MTVNETPSQLDRLGVRYIDRIAGPTVDDITALVRPEVRGIVGTSIATQAVHAISESLFNVTGAQMLARGQREAHGAQQRGAPPAAARCSPKD